MTGKAHVKHFIVNVGGSEEKSEYSQYELNL